MLRLFWKYERLTWLRLLIVNFGYAIRNDFWVKMTELKENLDVFKWSNEGGEQKCHFDEVETKLIIWRQILLNKSSSISKNQDLTVVISFCGFWAGVYGSAVSVFGCCFRKRLWGLRWPGVSWFSFASRPARGLELIEAWQNRSRSNANQSAIRRARHRFAVRAAHPLTPKTRAQGTDHGPLVSLIRHPQSPAHRAPTF